MGKYQFPSQWLLCHAPPQRKKKVIQPLESFEAEGTARAFYADSALQSSAIWMLLRNLLITVLVWLLALSSQPLNRGWQEVDFFHSAMPTTCWFHNTTNSCSDKCACSFSMVGLPTLLLQPGFNTISSSLTEQLFCSWAYIDRFVSDAFQDTGVLLEQEGYEPSHLTGFQYSWYC